MPYFPPAGGGGASAATDLSDYAELARLDAEQTLTNKTITDFSNTVAADEQHVQVYNDSGVLLGAGTPVYLTGYHFIGTAAPTVAKADATSAATMPCIGLTNEVIGNGNYGEVVVSGFINSVDTSAFSNGDTLYVSETAGELTATPPFPDGINQKQPVAVVLYAAGGGKLQVLGYGVETAASETQVGVVELATAAEVDAGTDDVRAISPASLAGSALQTQVDALGATLHTDAAADPDDGTGAVGDFHLRRDTGVLTGPMVSIDTEYGTTEDVDYSTDAYGGDISSAYQRFEAGASFTVQSIKVHFSNDQPSPGGSFTVEIRDSAASTTLATGTGTTVAGAVVKVDLDTPYEVASGTTYAIWVEHSTGGLNLADEGAGLNYQDSQVLEPSGIKSSFSFLGGGGGSGNPHTRLALVVASVPTWTGADTRILGDVVQADIANVLSDGDVTGVVHTDAAADPSDVVGEAGDFHLRRDTGVLTGPKRTDNYETLYSDTFKDAGTAGPIATTYEQGTRFTATASGVNCIGVRLPVPATEDDADYIGKTVRLWDGSTEVRSATVTEVVAGWAYGYFDTPYALANDGTVYTASWTRINGNVIVADAFEDDGSTLVDNGGSRYNITSGAYPNQTAGDYYGGDPLVENGGLSSTWIGADTLTLVDKSQVMVVVNHGADSTVARPTGVGAVYWIGSVTPDNMAAADLFYNTA